MIGYMINNKNGFNYHSPPPPFKVVSVLCHYAISNITFLKQKFSFFPELSKPAPARVQPMLLSLVQDQPRSPATRGHRIPKIKSLPQTPILIAMRNWFLNLKMPHCMKLA